MNFKQRVKQKMIPLLLTIAVVTSGIIIFPSAVQAAGWLDYADQTITLGTAVSGSMKEGDYCGQTEGDKYCYWRVYKFSMPQTGLLNIYLESLSAGYLSYNWNNDNGFVVFAGADPDKIIWRSRDKENEIKRNYSTSRAMYYGSTEIALEQGEYYFAVRQKNTNDTPYYLTLSYKEPVINVTSISLKPSKMTLASGTEKTIAATVLPNNATDKTIAWQSDNPSVATVDDGTVTTVSVGAASITATSSDGEITATCTVTVTCPHEYRTTCVPATKSSNGRLTEKCSKCGDVRRDKTIYTVGNVALAKKAVTYNGRGQTPSVIVKDIRGKNLTANTDYTLSYTGNMRDVGKHSIRIKFKGNYKGAASRTFTIKPKPTAITKVSPKKKGFTVSWKKQTAQTTGYELAYSLNKKFTKKNTKTISINKNKTSKKTVSKLKAKKKYYVRIRTYKNVKVNGRTTRLYSSWSKVKTVVTKANQRTKTKTVGTAKLTAKNKEARRAYQAVLREGQHIQMSYRQVKYALIDLDSDGIDELFIEILGSSASEYTFPVYTFKGGRAIKLIENPREGFVVYTDGTFCSVYGMAGYGENKYYKIKNGSLEKLLEMEGDNNLFGSTGVKWYLTKIGNKNASEAACQKWIKKFESSHKQLTLSYKDNTDENRNSMINKK